MSKYTTEVRFICEMYAGLTESTGLSGVDDVIESAREKVFDFKYPIFDDAYRGVLETKILKHFYTREIGAETVGLWKLWLNTRMNEVMPYYNKLYESELLEFNPLYDVDITREHSSSKDGTRADTGESKGLTTGESTGLTTGESTATGTGSETRNDNGKTTNTNKHDKYYSDTPQGGVGGLESHDYLTNATLEKDDGENTVENTGSTSSSNSATNVSSSNATNTSTMNTTNTNKNNTTIKDTEEYLEHVRGKNGGTSYAKMLNEYRTTFLNIDLQVINELNDLFMNLW